MATLAHALQLVGWWIAPLVILLIKRDSKFVSFHALQALLLQICCVLAYILFFTLWFVLIFSSVFIGQAKAPNSQPPPAIFFVFPFLWLFIMGAWVLVLVFSILYAVKAGRGEWANYPVLGNLARRILKMS